MTAQARPLAQSGERCSPVSVPPTCSPSEATKVRATREGEADDSAVDEWYGRPSISGEAAL